MTREKKFISMDGRLYPVTFQTVVLGRFMGADEMSSMLDKYQAAKSRGGANSKKSEYVPTEHDVSMWREWVAGKKISQVAKDNGTTGAKLMYKFMIVGKTLGKINA